jgi:hypothetical protein
MERIVERLGFLGILIFASVPNPFFDLAGITCGHFLVPFWTFFGATLIGKAAIKMHIQVPFPFTRVSSRLFQMLFVVIAFSEHHVERVVSKLGYVTGGSLPYPPSLAVMCPMSALCCNRRFAISCINRRRNSTAPRACT